MVGIGPSPNRPGIHMVKCRKKRGGREGSSARARSAAQQHSERDDNGYNIMRPRRRWISGVGPHTSSMNL